MAQYKITDNQSGKTLVISGDAPPTDQEAEQLFQESGIRGQGNSFNLMDYLKSSAQKGAQLSLAGGGPIPTFLAGTPEQKVAAVAGPAVGAAGLAMEPTLAGIAATKSINPMKVLSYLRNEAVNKAGELDTTKLIEAGEKFAANNPFAKADWEMLKPTISSSMPASDLLYKMTNVFGNAYTKGGAVRTPDQAQLLNQLYQGGKGIISEQAPEVAKYTAGMRNVLSAPENIQKITWLLAKLGLAKSAF